MICNGLGKLSTKPIRRAPIVLLLFWAAGCATDATLPKSCQSTQDVSCHDAPGRIGGSGQGSEQGNGGGMNHGMGGSSM
jgi:hypothetical protein